MLICQRNGYCRHFGSFLMYSLLKKPKHVSYKNTCHIRWGRWRCTLLHGQWRRWQPGQSCEHRWTDRETWTWSKCNRPAISSCSSAQHRMRKLKDAEKPNETLDTTLLTQTEGRTWHTKRECSAERPKTRQKLKHRENAELKCEQSPKTEAQRDGTTETNVIQKHSQCSNQSIGWMQNAKHRLKSWCDTWEEQVSSLLKSVDLAVQWQYAKTICKDTTLSILLLFSLVLLHSNDTWL